MSRSIVAQAYDEAVVEITGAHQRFLYGFGAQLEILATLLQKQHWQAAADILPNVEREKTSFESLLMEVAGRLSDKSVVASREYEGMQTIPLQPEEERGPGTVHGEAADRGEAAS